jgi:hypothetical protein
MRDLSVLLLAVLLAGPAAAQHDHAHHGAAAAAPASSRPATREWTRQPVLAAAMQRGGDRNAASLRPQNIEAAELVVFAAGGPDERRRVTYPIAEGGAKIESATPMVGNYHWVTARQESEAEVRVASTVWYFSNPGPAPTDLLKQARHELEIVPLVLPREHNSYRETEQWRFQVRWNGAPLADQTLTLETEFGSRSRYVTDAEGVATVLFPRDFQPAREGAEGGHGPRRAKFVLGAEREVEGRRYLTAFNYSYSPDPARERSLVWGAAFGLIGMVAALPLLRRRTATTDSAEKKDA